MSGSDRDSGNQPPADAPAADDPWAKWRQPEPQAVDAEKSPKPQAVREARVTKPAPVADVQAQKVTEVVIEKPAVKPEGTLGVRRSADAETAPRKRPLRGGALPRKPRADAPRAAEAKPAAPYKEKAARPKDAASKRDGDRKFDRNSADRNTGQDAGHRPAREARDSDPWARSARGSQKAENPWGERAAKPAAPKPMPAVQAPAEPHPNGVRLSKVMSERGLCSRREADLWIERGWVFVDGEQISELGTRIDPSAEISVSKEAVKDQAKAVTILLHKPVGYVSSQPEPGMQPAVTLITPEAQVVQSGDPEFKPWMLRGLAPAGRLDVDSTGLLVLTSDGRVAKRLIGEDSDAEKEYLVRVSGEMIKGGLDLLRHGLELDGKPLRQAWVKQLNEDQLHFILKEGKKRQIRRMCELVGLRVIGLKRVRIGRIRLGDLPMGQWRFLRADEAF